MSGVGHGFKKGFIARLATDIFGRTGLGALQAAGKRRVRQARRDGFDPDIMIPVVAEVIQIAEPVLSAQGLEQASAGFGMNRQKGSGWP